MLIEFSWVVRTWGVLLLWQHGGWVAGRASQDVRLFNGIELKSRCVILLFPIGQVYVIELAQNQREGTTRGHEYWGSWFFREHFGRLANAAYLKMNRSQSRMLGQVQSHKSVCSI